MKFEFPNKTNPSILVLEPGLVLNCCTRHNFIGCVWKLWPLMAGTHSLFAFLFRGSVLTLNHSASYTELVEGTVSLLVEQELDSVHVLFNMSQNIYLTTGYNCCAPKHFDARKRRSFWCRKKASLFSYCFTFTSLFQVDCLLCETFFGPFSFLKAWFYRQEICALQFYKVYIFGTLCGLCFLWLCFSKVQFMWIG